MAISHINILSTFLLGAFHSLEPGHGKSIVALHTSQSRKISDGISLLASLLLTHFLLTVIASSVLYFHPEWAEFEWIKFVAPFLIIFYGLFLLVKSKRNTDEYLACSCSHGEIENTKSPFLMGILAGLTPCPSVFAPIVICLSNKGFDNIFYYLFSYIFGVIFVFLIIFLGVLLLKQKSTKLIESLIGKFNPHLISGSIMILIGIFYLGRSLMHQH